ncbi:hypothetical protein B296_00020637 [Ensete ventricosum]|uniref:Uncharacterized protein n=1 Tax=Ensete ventricosum TaxID=4639 RepID=A0A426YSY2_ENSVE|nr:hypothetical protein B296_00020637 [Ensete ventricosum]
MSSVVVSHAMVKESAQLNSALVRKLVRKLRRGRLGPLESAPQVLLSCGLSKDPAQKPRQGGELDIAPSILKSVPRLRRDLNQPYANHGWNLAFEFKHRYPPYGSCWLPVRLKRYHCQVLFRCRKQGVSDSMPKTYDPS